MVGDVFLNNLQNAAGDYFDGYIVRAAGDSTEA
jgi:hypothetical protein